MTLMLLAPHLALVVATTLVPPPRLAWAEGYGFDGSESHPHAGVQTAEGGFIVAGDGLDYSANASKAVERSIFVMKTNGAGEMLWQQRIGACGFNYGKFAIEAADGSVILAGAITSCDARKKRLQRALVRLDGATGDVMQTLLLPNEAKAADVTRDGFMCVSVGASNQTLVATGFVRGESATAGYPDEPMFLIGGGSVVVAMFTLDLTPGAARGGALALAWEVTVDDSAAPYRAHQGMRVLHDAQRDTYVVSHTASFDGGATFEMGLLALDAAPQRGAKVRAPRWMRAFRANASASGGHASHPYALAQSAEAYAIGGLAVLYEPGVAPPVEQCEGRLVGVAPSDGALLWDRRWKTPASDPDANIECYGLQHTAADGGWILACGWGVEPELHPSDSPASKTWRVLVHKADRSGGAMWSANFSDNSRLQNNAGEYIVALRDGERFAVYVDAQSWGPSSTGGNFAILMLEPSAASVLSTPPRALTAPASAARLPPPPLHSSACSRGTSSGARSTTPSVAPRSSRRSTARRRRAARCRSTSSPSSRRRAIPPQGTSRSGRSSPRRSRRWAQPSRTAASRTSPYSTEAGGRSSGASAASSSVAGRGSSRTSSAPRARKQQHMEHMGREACGSWRSI